MTQSTLKGHSILVVEEEPLIAMDIALALEQAGAQVATAATAAQAIRLLENARPSAATVDHALPDGDGWALYQSLEERRIPFVVYSGYPKPDGVKAPYVAKPAEPEALVRALAGLLMVDRSKA